MSFKKRLWNRHFPVSFAKFLRIYILKNVCGWLLTKIRKDKSWSILQDILMTKSTTRLMRRASSQQCTLSVDSRVWDPTWDRMGGWTWGQTWDWTRVLTWDRAWGWTWTRIRSPVCGRAWDRIRGQSRVWIRDLA